MHLDVFCDTDRGRELFVPEHWKTLLHDNEHVYYLCLANPAFSTQYFFLQQMKNRNGPYSYKW